MKLQNHTILLLTPSLFTNIRIQMITPSLSTLLPNSAGQHIRNLGPFARAVLANVFFNGTVFFGGPGSFD
jgi:hypothetical protein